MTKQKTEFKIVDSKRRTTIMVFAMEILINNKDTAYIDVFRLDGVFTGFHETTPKKVLDKLSKREREELEELLIKY